jgi:hypothetical protein
VIIERETWADVLRLQRPLRPGLPPVSRSDQGEEPA